MARTGLRLAAGLILAAAGCSAVGPDYVPPVIDAPDAWHGAVVADLEGDTPATLDWWTRFDDPLLASLIVEAREHNRDLATVTARVEAVRQRILVADSGQRLQVTGEGAYTRARNSEDTALPMALKRTDDWTFGAGATWELDLFGGVKRSVEAATALHGAAVEDYRDALIVLDAAVANTWIEARTLTERLRYARSNVALQSETLDLVNGRRASGLIPDLDVSQAQASLATTEAFVPTLELAREEALHRLAILLGRRPGEAHALLDNEGGIPVPPESVIAGVPVDAIRRRPDVRRAERMLAARTAAVGVATADLYPRFTLNGFFGRAAENSSNLNSVDSTSWFFQPGFSWNLLAGGSVRAEIAARKSEVEGALAEYEGAVLRALGEGEDALAAVRLLRERDAALRRAVAAQEASIEQVRAQYDAGLVDFQNVLDTQRVLTRLQDERAAATGDVARAVVRFFRALGGGWSAEDGAL